MYIEWSNQGAAGALSFIKKLIGQKPKTVSDALAELALDPTRNDEFLRTLVQGNIWIMGQGTAMEAANISAILTVGALNRTEVALASGARNFVGIRP